MTFTRVEGEGQKERAKGRSVLRLLKLDSEAYPPIRARKPILTMMVGPDGNPANAIGARGPHTSWRRAPPKYPP